MSKIKSETLILASLAKFYKQNVQLKSTAKVLIIADPLTDPRVYNYLAKGALQIVPAENVEIFILEQAEGSHYTFPNDLKKLLRAADVIISPTTVSLYHSKEIQQALTPTKKFFSMTGAKLDTLYKYGAKADFVSLKKTAESLKELLTGCERITLLTEKGTHFSAVIKDRKANMETSLGIFGKSATFPDIEVNTSIIEESGEGRIIVDASAVGFGLIKQPMEFIVRAGRIVSIAGDDQAEKIFHSLQSVGDKNIYQIAEIGIGLNPFSKVYGVIIEDEAAYGTAHIGIGNNTFMGGLNKAKTHLDFVMTKPRIFLDGSELVLGENEIVYKGKIVGKIYR